MASKYKAQELFQLPVDGLMSKYHPNQGFTDLTTDITVELTIGKSSPGTGIPACLNRYKCIPRFDLLSK